jgi:hypothetical protein
MSATLAISDFDFVMRHSLMAFTEYTFRELFPQTPFSDSPHWIARSFVPVKS